LAIEVARPKIKTPIKLWGPFINKNAGRVFKKIFESVLTQTIRSMKIEVILRFLLLYIVDKNNSSIFVM